MVRRLFSLMAVVAVAGLLVAAEECQARERWFNFGGRRSSNDGMVNRGPIFSRFRDSTEPRMTDRQIMDQRRAYYYNPEGLEMPMRPNEALFDVRVPESAEVWVQGQKTIQKGMLRQYVSSNLIPNQLYEYEIKAKWMADGREVSQTRTVEIKPGNRLTVDFTKSSDKEKVKP
jgi:uncharacterized protein (TIGR03000 family)